MKRRDLLKSCLVAPFLGLFKSKKRSGTLKSKDLCGGQNGTLCSRCKFNEDKISAMSIKDFVDAQFNPVIDLQFNTPFEGKVVSMVEFQGNLWIATERGVYRIRERL